MMKHTQEGVDHTRGGENLTTRKHKTYIMFLYTRINVHVFWRHGQFLAVDYRLAQDDPVDKEASYWYYAPK